MRAPEVSQIGAPCPDHLISTKHRPLAVAFDPEHDGADELRQAFRNGVATYSDWYRTYYESHLSDESRPFPMDPPGPKVALVPGIGVVTSGSDAGRARVARDLYHRAIAVQDAADALGGFLSLTEAEAFAIEYWPLERYKLAQMPPRAELTGRIAVVTGGASGIGRATARILATRGAHVVVADLNLEGAETVADEIVAAHGLRRAIAVHVDVTSEDAVADMVRSCVLTYGGLDILVASAGIATSAPLTETTVADWELNFNVLARGYFLAARETFRVLLEQGQGGSLVFVGSKNALVAGANASAYSSAKAASLHLARCLAEEGGPHGIRVNTVNLVVGLEGRAREHLRRRGRRPSRVLPRPDAARRQRLSRGRRGGDRLPRRPPGCQVHRKCRQRRRRCSRRLPALRGAPACESSSECPTSRPMPSPRMRFAETEQRAPTIAERRPAGRSERRHASRAHTSWTKSKRCTPPPKGNP